MDDHLPKPWHAKTLEDVESIHNTSLNGLSDAEAAKRLKANGFNEIRQKKQKSVLAMLWEQLTDVMVLILIGAAGLSFILKEWTEAVVILVIVALNAAVSIIQEKKAANALEALKNMGAPTARVLREGEESRIPAKELVAGDLVYLEDGCIVPADIRLVSSNNLKIQEASLTGESVPVEKEDDALFSAGAPLGDRTNMAYSASVVMYGNGIGYVVETGMHTEVGQIATLLEEQDEYDTPLKRKLNSAGKALSIVGLLVCIIIFVIGSLYGRPWIPLLMTAVSLAISVIPEGLPATATIVMALGVQRMAGKNALVRKLPAVETLGGATVICCDKTGTLTQNRMTVTKIAMNGDFEAGTPTAVEKGADTHAVYRELVYAAALCNNASLDPDRPGEILGDPTEGALIFLTDAFGMDQEHLEEQYPRLFEQPFDSDRKRMTTVHRMQDGLTAYTKGAVDEMIPLCTHILTSHGVRPITEKDRLEIRELCLNMSAEALRVLGFAKRMLPEIPQEDDTNVEYDLTFLGAVGMIDPPRKEVVQAVETCRNAGIRTIMITGDHKITAVAIAKQLSIFREGNTVISGDELHSMSDPELDQAMKNTTVFARVSPSDKLRIIESLQRTGEIAAMTGDGVNDAPALKAANIGVAMGKSGTDVAKDAADMLLLDDNFTTIEYAIREGRRIYRNIQKVIQFLLAGNIAEILTLLIATLLNWEAPILAVHILLINLVTDSLPAIALGVDPASKNIMKHKPVKSGTLFERGLVVRVVMYGIFITMATVAAYQFGLSSGGYPVGMTMAFLVLAISQMFHALNQRSNTDSIFTSGVGQNKLLLATMVVSGVVLAIVVLTPALRRFFSLSILSGGQWMITLAFSLIPLALVELTKLIQRKVS
ncbi:cation-translocating P-type ATPase [Oscillospiraceae bacterium MB08-C2-2]|nr:cation-translocating P-type ATPase [Oscillospiraceae bacterium MB08-C2-2]